MKKVGQSRLMRYLVSLALLVTTGSVFSANAATIRVECENMSTGGTYTGKITTPFSGVALYGNNDYCATSYNFTVATNKISVRGCSNNSSTAQVAVLVGGTQVGTLNFSGTTASVQSLVNVNTGTGTKEIRLTVKTDTGAWDAYVDYLEVSDSTTSPTANVMPLGDSITDGTQVPGGYRIKLKSNASSNGLSVNFVGSLKNGPTELTDREHEGHSGWRIDQIDANINNWMTNYTPKIVLLHIGTNDVLQNYNVSTAPSRLSALIDKICAKLPAGGKLYVAKIIPLSNSGQNQNVINFNNQIPGIVQSKVSQGKPVYLVDMYSALKTSDLIDGVHPTRNGYDKMADVWFSAIRNDLK